MKLNPQLVGTGFITVLVLALAACSGGQNPTPPASGLSAQSSMVGHNGSARFNSGNQTLAVSSCGPCATFTNTPSYEYLFAIGSRKNARVVSNGIAAPWVGLLFDSSKDLFVANCSTCMTGQSGVNNVVEIPPHASTPSVVITNGITYPYDLAMDAAGTLYVSNLGCYSPSCESTVVEYPKGYTSGNPAASIVVKYPLGLAIDKEQNLYVANCVSCSTGSFGSDQVLEYAPGSTTPMRTIATGVNEPVALAVDSSDDLYVANCENCGLGAAAYLHGTDTVTEYTSTGTTPVKTITFSGSTPDVPFSLVVDKADDLFVGNYAASTVTEYPPNATTPSVTISNGVSNPASLAIDAKGTLNVSNAGANTVTKYRAGYKHGKPIGTVAVPNPSSIAISP